MFELPDYVCVQFDGYGERFDPSVERVEMERGVPKQRVMNSQVLMKINATFVFRSASEIIEFDSWYFDVIGRIGWFAMPHPRTGQMINARFEGGGIGTLAPLTTRFSVAQRQVVIEYLR